MPRSEFNSRLAGDNVPVSVPTSAAVYLDERLSLLNKELDQTNALASGGELPDAKLNSAGLKISPLENSVPKEGEAPQGCTL